MAFGVAIAGAFVQYFRGNTRYRIAMEIGAVLDFVANPFEAAAGDSSLIGCAGGQFPALREHGGMLPVNDFCGGKEWDEERHGVS